MLEGQFKLVTQRFYNGEYEEGVQQLDRLIASDPTNSNLYSNRALFYSQLQEDDRAIADLHHALDINPRNYIAYFNLFSVQSRTDKQYEAFQDLCCSLSCLYLINAKLTKKIDSVNNSIKYSYNNVEAHLLKGLILSQQGKYIQSYKSFQEATLVDPLNQKLKIIKSISFSKAFPNEKETNDQIDLQKHDNLEKKLRCSYKVSEQSLGQQICQRLNEFNQLYTRINGEVGAVTQKVPKGQSINQNIPLKINQPNDAFFIVEDPGQSTPKQSEVRPQPGNIFMRTSKGSSSIFIDSKIIKNQEQIFINERKGKQSSHSQEDEQFQSIINSNVEDQQSISKAQNKNFDILKEEEIQYPVLNEVNPLTPNQIAEDQKMIQFESFISVHNQNAIDNQQMFGVQKYNLIYPLDIFTKLKIYAVKFQFQVKDASIDIKYKDVYCIISYNNSKTKLKTITKKCLNSLCQWNEDFPPVDISSQPSDMKIKVYNKKYDSIRDQLLGEVQVLITTADLLKLPLFNKKGDNLGDLYVRLQLIDTQQQQLLATEQN